MCEEVEESSSNPDQVGGPTSHGWKGFTREAFYCNWTSRGLRVSGIPVQSLTRSVRLPFPSF